MRQWAPNIKKAGAKAPISDKRQDDCKNLIGVGEVGPRTLRGRW